MKKDAHALAQEFADAIIKQNQAIYYGTTKEVRRYGNKLAPITKKLRAMGDEGKQAFATLLHRPDREIRGTVAVYLVNSMTEEALAVFRELAEGDDFIAHTAKLRIKDWEEHPESYDAIGFG